MSHSNEDYDPSKDWQGATAYAPYVKQSSNISLEKLAKDAAKLYGDNDRVGGQAYAAPRRTM